MECPRYGIEGPRPSLEVGVIRRGRPYMNLHQSNVHAKVLRRHYKEEGTISM